MKYLVTGGAGFIGSHLVDYLLNFGHQVSVIDSLVDGWQTELTDKPITFYYQDIKSNLKNVFKTKYDAVFHLAALPRVQWSILNPIETHEVNVNGTLNLLLACRDAGVKRFVFSSSSSVYGNQKTLPFVETMQPNPMSPYALHKLIDEQYGHLFTMFYGLEVISLRYFNVYGPNQKITGAYATVIPKFIDAIKNNMALVINGDGEQSRDFTYVLDVVKANLLAAQTTNKDCFGEVFNIGAGRDYTVNYITRLLLKKMKSYLQPLHGPAVIEPRKTLADISKAKKMLGWQPRVKFEEGIDETLGCDS